MEAETKMKTVKEVAGLTGISIRTLRYYDEIGLLKPAQTTAAGYRLYDSAALQKLQEIMFFKELEIPLADIRAILENPGYDRKQALLAQKALLERKRNRLNGIIELICDVMEGDNTMSFEAFNNEDIQKILDHTLKNMKKEMLEEQIEKYGSVEKYREYLALGFQNEQTSAVLLRWYGGKEQAMKAVLESSGNMDDLKRKQDRNAEINKQFATAKETGDNNLAKDAVAKLAECYKEMFQLDNARNMLLDLAKEYLQSAKLAETMDSQYGEGFSEYIAKAIQDYYGI